MVCCKKFNPWAFDERIAKRSGGLDCTVFTHIKRFASSVSLVLKGLALTIRI